MRTYLCPYIEYKYLQSNLFSEPRKAMPNFKTDEPVCPKDQLQCGNGECINKELFCNDRPDCKDESDENACSKCYIDCSNYVTVTWSIIIIYKKKIVIYLFVTLGVETDPNRAPDCDPTQCVLPDCFCSADGTRIPGGLEPTQVTIILLFMRNTNSNVFWIFQINFL